MSQIHDPKQLYNFANFYGNIIITFGLRFLAQRAAAYMQSTLYAIARLFVRLSVTRVDQSKTVEVRIMQFSPYSRPIGPSLSL